MCDRHIGRSAEKDSNALASYTASIVNAVQSNSVEEVADAIRAGASPNAQDQYGTTVSKRPFVSKTVSVNNAGLEDAFVR